MATSGPNQSGAVAEFDDGWTPWSNTGNAITFDQVYATCGPIEGGGSEFTNFLDYTSFGTFTGIGSGDSVTDVLVEVAGKIGASGTIVIESVQLIVGGNVVGNAATVASLAFTGTESYKAATQGVVPVTDFGTTLNGSQLTSDFGVRVQFRNNGSSDTISVDACRVTLTYTPAASFSPGRVKATNGIAGSGVF